MRSLVVIMAVIQSAEISATKFATSCTYPDSLTLVEESFFCLVLLVFSFFSFTLRFCHHPGFSSRIITICVSLNFVRCPASSAVCAHSECAFNATSPFYCSIDE